MSHRELWEDHQGLQVDHCRLLNETLLSFDVDKIPVDDTQAACDKISNTLITWRIDDFESIQHKPLMLLKFW